jgi:ComF family protein
MIKQILSTITKVLYPPFCYHCNTALSNHDFLCESCLKKLHFRVGEFCQICGATLQHNECPVCKTNSFEFTQAFASFDLIPELRSLIHHLKYKENAQVGIFLGQLAGRYIQQYHADKKIDIITPVPLHKVKKRMRGYNQALWIAKGINQIITCELIPELIIRTRFTQTQTRLTRKRRKKNVSHAFMVNSKYNVENKTIMFIDDVFTTGSTMNEVSSALKHYKVNKIYAMTVAKA